MKKKTVTYWKKKVWIVFSLYIRERDNWMCITCGKVIKGVGMHAGHFISRSYTNTLFDQMNVHAQCAGCNIYKRGNLHIYSLRIIERYGIDEYKKLIERGKISKKFTIKELEQLYKYYKQKNCG